MHVERRAVRIWDAKKRETVTVTVQVEIDITAIAEQYAAKANTNKSRQVKQCHGSVIVKIKD